MGVVGGVVGLLFFGRARGGGWLVALRAAARALLCRLLTASTDKNNNNPAQVLKVDTVVSYKVVGDD